ncbi:MAG: HAD-IA family hydrolase [Bifidobacteriaceae bacterium]|jgi:HAD superfamily hydrolase (TIGR01509 family)|nr:HAD-IA family hydrolase [Bifidobacteriaceae bacterium]
MDGYLFDLDGVLVPTAALHQQAWAALFGEFFAADGVRPPYGADDYYKYVDGRPRCDGVAAVLASRGLTLPWGDPFDPPTAPTVCGLGNRKDQYFNAALAAAADFAPYPETVPVLQALGGRGAGLAVVTSSENATQVLARAGLTDWFPVVVDGRHRRLHGLAGKPAPDTFTAAAGLLGLSPARCAVVEDAVAGVAAGRAGGFGLVAGVDRGAGAPALAAAGADAVMTSLEGLL